VSSSNKGLHVLNTTFSDRKLGGYSWIGEGCARLHCYENNIFKYKNCWMSEGCVRLHFLENNTSNIIPAGQMRDVSCVKHG